MHFQYFSWFADKQAVGLSRKGWTWGEGLGLMPYDNIKFGNFMKIYSKILNVSDML